MKIQFFKKAVWYAVFTLSIVTGVGTYAAAAELGQDEMVVVKLEKPITLEETTESQAVVANVNKKAMELGLNQLRIHGSNEFTKTEEGTVRTSIDWHSISLTNNNDGATEALTKTLASQFRTDSSKAEVGTLLTARGDWENVLDALTSLREKAANKVTKVESADEEDEEGDSESGYETVGSTGSPTYTTSDGDYDSVATDVMSTSYESCPDFIDEASMTVYEQKRKYTTGSSGTVYEEGLCTNTGLSWEIEEVDGDCAFQFNYEEMIATKMVQWQYDKDGTITEIEGCRESSDTYPIVPFSDQCEMDIDEANGVAFAQVMYGIEIDGIRYYGTDCQPVSSVTYTLYEEYCLAEDNATKTYHHDFVNNISYPYVRKYYLLNEGEEDEEKVYINECSISGTESYVHNYETEACGWEMNDELLQAQQLSTTYIEAPEGTVEIQSCAARTSPVAYAYVGLSTNSTKFEYTGDYETGEWQTFSAPSGVTSLTVTLVAGGDSGGVTGIGGNPYKYALGKIGGSAGGRREDVSLTIEDGETVPVYVGARGYVTITGQSQFGHKYYGTVDAEPSIVGDDSSSFTAITAPISQYPGTAPNQMYGGPGAVGYYLDEDTPSSKNGQQGNVNFCTTTRYSTKGVCFGGSGSIGYGAGGGGVPGVQNYQNDPAYDFPYYGRGGDGADGVAIISYQTMKYLRPDSTYYEIPFNE